MRFVVVYEHYLLTLFKTAALYAPYSYAADVIGVVECGYEHLHGTLFVPFGRRDMRYYRVEKRGKVAARFIGIDGRYTHARGSVHYRAVELAVVRAEVEEKFENFVHHFLGAGVGAIHFVDHYHRGQSERERVFENETRLRHGPLERIHEQHHAVYHFEYAFHFAAEIRVTRGIDDVYFIVLIVDGGVFRKYGYAALAFERVGIHYAFGRDLPRAERSALFKHLIHERGLAVVDMGYYSYVSYLFVYHSL